MAELVAKEQKAKEYVVKITYSTYKDKPTMQIGTGFKDMVFGKVKARMLVEHIDAIRAFAEQE